jgi:hypothetical protein
MSRCSWLGSAVAAILVTVSPSLAYGARGPTASQIRTAVRKAERSRDLWATVNICDTKRYSGVIGIRGQMPSLGFRANLDMNVGVDYWVRTKHKFVPVPRVSERVSLDSAQLGLRQGGVRFKFGKHAGHLRGSVTFEWRLGRRIIGSVTRTTRGGHPGADFGDPLRFSASQCWIL